MLSLADSIIHNALSTQTLVVPLSAALRGATVAQIARAVSQPPCEYGCWRVTAWRWLESLRTAHTADAFAGRADECFSWVVHEFRPSSSPLVGAVADRLDTGMCPEHAVRAGLLRADHARVHHNLLRHWCTEARRLRRPAEVASALGPLLLWTPLAAGNPRAMAAALAMWVKGRVEYIEDKVKWGRPDFWQSPALTLASGTGDCEDSSLVVWSALPLVGLGEGVLVVGARNGEGHAWVELPELGLLIESTDGQVTSLPSAGYEPWLYALASGDCLVAPGIR